MSILGGVAACRSARIVPTSSAGCRRTAGDTTGRSAQSRGRHNRRSRALEAPTSHNWAGAGSCILLPVRANIYIAGTARHRHVRLGLTAEPTSVWRTHTDRSARPRAELRLHAIDGPGAPANALQQRMVALCRDSGYLFHDVRSVPGQGSIEVAGGVVLTAAVHGDFVGLTHGMRFCRSP